MTEIVVVPGSEVSVEAETEVEAPAAEATADAAVEIARIEGETAVALAEIQADENERQAEVLAETINNGMETELGECRITIQNLEAENSGLKSRVTDLEAQLSTRMEPPSPEPNQPLEPESVEQTPANPEQAAEEKAEPPKRAKRPRWI
jgi:hypothetical protein